VEGDANDDDDAGSFENSDISISDEAKGTAAELFETEVSLFFVLASMDDDVDDGDVDDGDDDDVEDEEEEGEEGVEAKLISLLDGSRTYDFRSLFTSKALPMLL